MDLPDSGMLNFFNKVLISLSDLSPLGDACHVESLMAQCKSIALGGQIPDYENVLLHCQQCGLLQVKKEIVIISVLGQKFLDSNRDRFFELTESQKILFTEKVIFKGSWNSFARDLFKHFSPNFKTETYEISIIDVSLPDEYNSTVHLFKYLGILHVDDTLIWVDKKYSDLVYQLTADTKAMSEQQLEKILMENRKLGAKAENAVVEFEKERLKKLGKFALAELVKRISTMDVGAGYDIESFDGTSDNFEPNRFIEVKATQSDEIRFYWTNNEMKVAKRKKSEYWIYLLRSFREDRPLDSFPIMIQDPEHIIPKHDLLSMEVSKYLISEISEIELTKCSLENVTWYKL